LVQSPIPLINAALSPRDRIIKIALHLFYLNGFHAVGTNQICAEAGVNKSTLYHIFPSKVDMVLAALEVYAGDLTQQFRQIAQSAKTPTAKIEQIFEMPFLANQSLQQQFGHVKGCFVGNIALELSGQEERVRLYLTQVFQRWAEAIEPIVQELAIGQNLDTSKVSQSIIAYLQGAILMAKTVNNPQLIQDLARSAVALVR
jgi:TetR/AcrR family transcriptional regulator, transcriptional repressor for nem operon